MISSPLRSLALLPLLLLLGAAPSTQPLTLVFSETYTTAATTPDPATWSYETGYVRNREAQYYTTRPSNCRIENGLLVLEGRRESISTNKQGQLTEYTSASIETRDKKEWLYGRFEIRARFTQARGTWPAIWMLGHPPAVNGKAVPWPDEGEIDIMENVGLQPDVVHGSVHTKAYNHINKKGKGSRLTIPNLSDGFHTYILDWSEEKLDLLVDDQLYFTFKNEHKTEAEWPFCHPAYLKLNLAIGGEWGGQKGIDEAAFPQRMEIQSIKVYQRTPPPTSLPSPPIPPPSPPPPQRPMPPATPTPERAPSVYSLPCFNLWPNDLARCHHFIFR